MLRNVSIRLCLRIHSFVSFRCWDFYQSDQWEMAPEGGFHWPFPWVRVPLIYSRAMWISLSELPVHILYLFFYWVVFFLFISKSYALGSLALCNEWQIFLPLCPFEPLFEKYSFNLSLGWGFSWPSENPKTVPSKRIFSMIEMFYACSAQVSARGTFEMGLV